MSFLSIQIKLYLDRAEEVALLSKVREIEIPLEVYSIHNIVIDSKK